MTEENKELMGMMVGIANVYKDSSEVMATGNMLIKLLAERQNILFQDKKLEFDRVILAQIILVAIDIEILLKAISLADNDNYSKEHDWVKLYNSLSSGHQQEIKDSMSEPFKTDFDKYLIANKDAFIRWRYCYEDDQLKCDWTFIHDLANVLAGIAMKLAK